METRVQHDIQADVTPTETEGQPALTATMPRSSEPEETLRESAEMNAEEAVDSANSNPAATQLQPTTLQLLKDYVLENITGELFRTKVNKDTLDIDKLDATDRDNLREFLVDRINTIRFFSKRVAEKNMQSTAKTAAVSTVGGLVVAGIFAPVVGFVATASKVSVDHVAYRYREKEHARELLKILNQLYPQQAVVETSSWSSYLPNWSIFGGQSATSNPSPATAEPAPAQPRPSV